MTPQEIFQQAQAAHRAGNGAEAERLYRAVIEAAPPNPVLYFALSHSQILQERWLDALESIDQAIALKPDFLQAVSNKGILLQQMNRPDEALAAFERAVALNPNLAETHNQYGTALADLGRLDEAISAFRHALRLSPKFARAWFNLGATLASTKSSADALAAYDAGLALEPNAGIQAARFFTGLYVCDWRGYDGQCAAILDAIDQGTLSIAPFQMIFLPSSAQQQRRIAEKFSARNCPPRPALKQHGARKAGRLRIAYLSRDWGEHPVTYLLAGTLKNHDRDAFEIFVVSYGGKTDSPAIERVKSGSEHFIDLHGADDRAIAQHICDLDIDIAIDLDGHTKYARPGILAHRPAPVQANYLGYPGTMGAAHIDYLLADSVITPPAHQPFYSEQLVQLPDNYLPASPRPTGAPVSRLEAGLPETGFVFCAFTSGYKITPDVFAIWMRLLARTPGSVLWLRDGESAMRDNLRREAESRGIDPSRLIFAPSAPAKIHFARMALAGLYLDTFIYGAHTTASDALWSGVPVLTLAGECFARRVAASLLTVAGLPELIARTPDEYENIAVALANDPVRLAQMKTRLAENKVPLFDPARFARHLEAAYRAMWERFEVGEKPAGFAVEKYP